MSMCQYCTLFLFLCFDNKVVVGSGSEVLPNTQGRVWHTGYFYGIFNIFHMCVPTDVPHQVMHTLVHNVMTLHHAMVLLMNTDDVMS